MFRLDRPFCLAGLVLVLLTTTTKVVACGIALNTGPFTCGPGIGQNSTVSRLLQLQNSTCSYLVSVDWGSGITTTALYNSTDYDNITNSDPTDDMVMVTQTFVYTTEGTYTIRVAVTAFPTDLEQDVLQGYLNAYPFNDNSPIFAVATVFSDACIVEEDRAFEPSNAVAAKPSFALVIIMATAIIVATWSSH